MLDFDLLGVDTRGVLTHDTHVAFGSFHFLVQAANGQFALHRIALFAPDGFVQRYDGIFELDQTSARFFRELICVLDFFRQCLGARFKLPQLAFECQQSGAFFESARISGVDKLAARDPVAVEGDVHLAGRDRLHHRVFEVRRQTRTHLLRQRALEDGNELLRRAEQIRDAQIVADAFDLTRR